MSRNSLNEVQLVIDADEMDTSTFAKHMTYRHLESLGGLNYLTNELAEYVEECWRIFHDRLHDVRIDLEHEHKFH